MIKGQLNRYLGIFNEVRDRCISMQVDFTSRLLKKEFDDKFKKTPGGKNIFFDAYDEFTAQKIKNQEWKPAYFCHNSYVAEVLDLEIIDNEPVIHKVYAAVDCVYRS